MNLHGFPPPLPAARPFDLIGLGANAADHLVAIPHHPRPGEKVRFSHYTCEGGGQTATALVTAARLGYRTRYIGGVGDDAEGRANLAGLEREGVDVSAVRVRPGGLTQRAFILVDEATGERTIVWGRSEGLVVGASEICAEVIASGRLLHTDAQDPRAAARAARMAHQAGMPVMADLEGVRPGLEELLPHLDYLVSAAGFPALATGCDELSGALRALSSRTPALLIVTCGSRGAVAWLEDRLAPFPAYQVDPVDTTGAGDVFHGAFAVACLEGMPLPEALDFCNAVAAMKCRAPGGRDGIPESLAAVEEFRQRVPHRPGG